MGKEGKRLRVSVGRGAPANISPLSPPSLNILKSALSRQKAKRSSSSLRRAEYPAVPPFPYPKWRTSQAVPRPGSGAPGGPTRGLPGPRAAVMRTYTCLRCFAIERSGGGARRNPKKDPDSRSLIYRSYDPC